MGRTLAVAIAVSLGLGGVAGADDKPSVAVLEIVAKDTSLDRAASAVTAALRTRAGAKTSGYKVKGSRKEIDTAMLAAECSTIQASCSVALATKVGADYAIVGELDRRGGHRILTLSLVDARAKQRIRAVREVGAMTGDAKKLARTAYTRLIGDDVGALTVVANAENGDVLVDGHSVAALFEGKATIEGLVNGTHQLSIHARGFKPFDAEVEIQYATTETVLLDPEE
jgi:hypothetical protein